MTDNETIIVISAWDGMHFRKHILIILSFCAASLSSAEEYEKLTGGLDSLRGNEFSAGVKRAFGQIVYSYDRRMQQDVSGRIFRLTAGRGDEQAHMYSLAYRALFSDSACTDDLHKALELALKYDEADVAGHICDGMSAQYLQRARYDSAMTYLLKSSDLYQHVPGANLENIRHRIGDLYYSAQLDEQAADVYREILEKYDQPEKWNFWRPYVLLNNLGQIALRAKNYEQAEEYFVRSRTNQIKYLRGLLTHDYYCVVNLRLAEVFYGKGNPEEDRSYLEDAGSVPVDSVSDYVKAELCYWKSFFAFQAEEYGTASPFNGRISRVEQIHRPFRFAQQDKQPHAGDAAVR